MLETENALITFRIGVRPDDPVITIFTAERLPDHRTEYLTYEGPLSNNRGTVTRISTGHCQIEAIGPDRMSVRLFSTPAGDRLWTGRALDANLWQFKHAPGR